MDTLLTSRSVAASSRFFLILIVGVFVLHSLWLSYPNEDVHITFRFARHLAEGHGIVWNISEPPIEGYTNFLWMLMTALAIWLGLDVVTTTQIASMLAAVGTILVSYLLAARFICKTSLGALVAPVLLAASGPMAAWGGSGMEMTAYGFVVILSVYAHLNHLARPSFGWIASSGFLLFIATLLRPEGVMIFLAISGLAVTVFFGETRSTLRHQAVWILSFAVPLAIYVAWRLNTFPDLLPNTFYQKTGGGLWQHIRGFGYVVYFAFFFLIPLIPIPFLLAWESGWSSLRAPWSVQRIQSLIADNRGVIVCAGLASAYFAYNVYAGGDYMPMYRFMVPAIPFIYLLLGPMAERLYSLIADVPNKRALSLVVAAIAVGGTFIHSTPIEKSFFRKATWQLGNYQGIERDREYVARFELIGRFFAEYDHEPGASLATRSIGLIGFYAKDLDIHDLSGLTDRHIAHVQVKSTPQGWAGHEKWDLDYSFHRKPTFFMLDENFAQEDIAGIASATELADAIERHYPASRYADWIRDNPDFIEANYRVRTVWLEDERNGDSGYFAFLERIPAGS